MDEVIISKIQGCVKGMHYRMHNLPNSIKTIQTYLQSVDLSCSDLTSDGRTNSILDETKIISILKGSSFSNRLYIPDKRHWFDIAIKDYRYGWLPINIKTTTTKTADNTGNLAMCVYALTNFDMNKETSYQNGQMSRIFIKHIKRHKYNTELKRDYYFIVVNKKTNDVIANSIRGLTKLTPNINNLPFQVKWIDNTKYTYKPIRDSINMVREAIIKPKPSWRETFLCEMRGIKESIA